MADSSIQICYSCKDQCINRNFFSSKVTTSHWLTNKIIINNNKTVQKAFGNKPEALGHCYSLLILWLGQFKKKTLKVRACLSFSSTVNSWMLSVASRIDSALQFDFSISRIGSLLVISLMRLYVLREKRGTPQCFKHVHHLYL